MGRFKFLDLDLGFKLPQLVLGIKYEEGSLIYKFKPEYNFLDIQHQTSGNGCHQHYIQGKLLSVYPRYQERLKKIEEKWLESNTGVFGVSLDEVLEYRRQIKSLFGSGVDCNFSYLDFEEGIYPLDVREATLKKLTKDKLPKDLDDLIDWVAMGKDNLMHRSLGSIGRWGLWILGENSD